MPLASGDESPDAERRHEPSHPPTGSVASSLQRDIRCRQRLVSVIIVIIMMVPVFAWREEFGCVHIVRIGASPEHETTLRR